MTKKNIVIVGYPKSGTTWVCRLVAELVGCPLVGSWGYETHDALYREGVDRFSKYQCFKSHHTFDEIDDSSPLDIHKTIYVIRDPRDIVISGAAFFYFTVPYLTPTLKTIRAHTTERLLNDLYNRLSSKRGKRRRMIKAVLHGNRSITHWLKSPWKDHYSSYLKSGSLFVRYEDLSERPRTECNRIMRYLNIETNDEHIDASIENQSFQKRKQEFSNRNDNRLTRLFRKGSSGYWKQEFTPKEIRRFKTWLGTSDGFYEF